MRKATLIRTLRIKRIKKREAGKRKNEVHLLPVEVVVVVEVHLTAVLGHRVAPVHLTVQAQDPHPVPARPPVALAVPAQVLVPELEQSAGEQVVVGVAVGVQSKRKSKKKKRRKRNQRNQNQKDDQDPHHLAGNVRNVLLHPVLQRFMLGD